MKERGGRPSPRGYCVRRYPFEREVSRNALKFHSPGSGQPASSRSPTSARRIRGTSDVPDANRPCGNLVICAIPSSWGHQATSIAPLGIAAPMASLAIPPPTMTAPLPDELRRCLPAFPRGSCSLIHSRAEARVPKIKCISKVYLTSLKAIGLESFMCGRLNQFANIPALSFAGKKLHIERRKKKDSEDKKAEAQVINNICPTDYSDVFTREGDEIGIDRMRFGLVPTWAKGRKSEVAKKFALTFNARCESIHSHAEDDEAVPH